MQKANYYKNFFLISSLWNFAAGLLCWLGAIFMTDFLFDLFEMPLPDSLFPFHVMFFFVIMLGIGYYIVSRDISKNRGIVQIGMWAKTGFFLITLITVLINEANYLVALFGLVDLIFAVLFFEFLHRTKSREA
jgi:hypothetical protein